MPSSSSCSAEREPLRARVAARRRACRRSASRGSAPARTTGGAVSAARRAQRLDDLVQPRARLPAEKRERDVEVVARHDRARASSRACHATIASASVVREPKAAEEPDLLIAFDPSGTASHGFVTILCQKPPQEVERRDRRAPADRLAVRPVGELDPVRRLGRLGVDVARGRPASRACRRPGRRRRSRRPRRPRRAARARPPPSPPPSRPRPRRAARASRAGRRARAPSPRSRTRRPRRGRRRSSPGTEVSRAATMPPVHDSAVASVQPRARQQLEHELLDGRARPRAKRCRASARRAAPSADGLRAGAEQVDVDLEVACADRRVDARRLAARLGERRATSDSLAPKKRSTRCAGGSARASTRRTGSVSSARGHSRCSSRRRPGQHDHDASPVSQHEPGAVPASPSETRPPAASPASRTPGSKSAYGPAQPLGDRAGDALDLARRSSSSTRSGSAGGARDELDGAVVVRRAEPARDDAEVGAEPLARARPRARPRRRRRSMIAPARARGARARARGTGRCGPLRSPRTSSLPVTTT